METTLKISKIKDGTVIDHIPAGKSLKVLSILGISEVGESTVSVAMRVQSGQLGHKDVVKIENRTLQKKELDKLSLLAPNASISIIKNFEIVKKFNLSIPDAISGVVECQNQNCITKTREPVAPSFHVISRKPIVIKCDFCERTMSEPEIHQLF